MSNPTYLIWTALLLLFSFYSQAQLVFTDNPIINHYSTSSESHELEANFTNLTSWKDEASIFNPDTKSSLPSSEWFEEAKFGMFIHFGLYSVAGGEWQGKPVQRNKYAEWLRAQALWPERMLTRKEYDTLLQAFNPTKFDAEQWVLAARQAGMRYLIVTAKHHDGFALWPSKVSDYNVVEATPFQRDLLGELAQACQKHGLKLGFYYSHWQDWGNGGAMPPWPVQEKDYAVTQPSDQAYEKYWYEFCLPQVKELLVNYEPDLMWFDSWHEPSPALTDRRVADLVALVRSTRPQCLINGRINFKQQESSEQIDFLSMNDNYIPDTGSAKPWEAPGTMNDSWGYNKNDYGWKPSATLLENLIKCFSRGGNYTLNVGPLPDGTFPVPATRRLEEMGAWLTAHQEAVWGSSPAQLPEPAWGKMTKQQQGDSTQLYLFVTQEPKPNKISLSLDKSILKAQVLETGQPVEWVEKEGKIELALPVVEADPMPMVVKLSVKGQVP